MKLIIWLTYIQGAFHDYQLGFSCAHRNTSGVLTSIPELIRENVNKNKISPLISLYLSKAFDRLPHSLLTFTQSLFNQFASINNVLSAIAKVNSGVRQCSAVGPILFNLFLKDVIEVINTDGCMPMPTIFSFSWAVISGLLITESKVNERLARINDNRAGRNGISLNIKISDMYIEFPEYIRCLGIILESKLTFSINKKVSLTLRWPYNINVYLPTYIKLKLATLLMSYIN